MFQFLSLLRRVPQPGVRSCADACAPIEAACVPRVAACVPGVASCVLWVGRASYRDASLPLLPAVGSRALRAGGCACRACGKLLTLAAPRAVASACSRLSVVAVSGRRASPAALDRLSSVRQPKNIFSIAASRDALAFRRLLHRAILPLTILARFSLISSFAVWRPSGVVQGLQTPPGTPDGVWRPSGVKSSLQALRGLKVSGGPARPLRTLRHLQTPQIESGGPQGSPRASTHLQAPQIESGGPQGSPRDPKGAGEAPLGATAKRCFFHPLSGGNRETVFLSPPEVPFR